MRRLCMFGGLLLAICGASLIFMLYGFGTMMDPAIEGAAREAAIWRKVIGDPAFPVGILLLMAGGWLMFHEPRRAA